jgi:hypothetical protein
MYHAAKARKAGKQKLDEIYRMIEAVMPPGIELDPTKLIQAPELLLEEIKLEGPAFDAIVPQKFAMVEKYMPEAVPFIAEKSPELVQQSERGKMGQQAQFEALQELRRVGRAGADDPIAQAATQQALRRAQGEAQSRQQSILQDAQRRGIADSNLAVASQLQGQSDAMERAALLGQNANAEAYARSLQAMRDSGRMGQELSNEEFGRQATNTDIINSFNQRMSARQQDLARMNADIRNTGQLRNVDVAQGLADKNVATGNEMLVKNRDFEMDKAGFKQSEQNRLNQGRMTEFGAKAAVQDDLMRRQQMDYENRMGKAKDLAGAKGAQYQDIGARAQGTAQNIKGITDAAAAYVNPQKDEDEKLKKGGY